MAGETYHSRDVIIMGHILHDRGLEEKRQLIAKAHAALPKGGVLIVCEAIIDDHGDKTRLAYS